MFQHVFRPCGITKIIKVCLGNTASQPSSDLVSRTCYSFIDVTAVWWTLAEGYLIFLQVFSILLMQNHPFKDP